MGELKPDACPFCGSDQVGDRGFRRFECLGCGAQGPARKTRDEAIAAWNRRPDPSGVVEALKEGDLEFLISLTERSGGNTPVQSELFYARRARILAALRSSATVQKGEPR